MTEKQKKLLFRIIIAGLLALPCFFIPDTLVLVKTVAFLFPYAVAAHDIVLKALRNIKHRQIFDENLLMCIATIGAYCLGEFSESVMVVLLYQTGELFQSCAVSHSRKSIASLMDIRPDYANVINPDGSYSTVSPDIVCIDDIILIKSGERIPLDCIVIQGTSEIDTSSLTGEALPKTIAAGDELISGCINLSGTLQAKVTKLYSESTVAKILELTENSAERKSKSENFITKFARYYTPIVCALALAMAIIPTIIRDNFAANLKSALIFLVVSCPCALVISVPLSFFCGIGCASKKGILIKGAGYLETLSMVDTVVFDKTGTLTCGEFDIIDINCYNGFTKEAVLSFAAKAEFYSNHPIALAVKKSFDTLTAYGITESKQLIGKGVYAKIFDKSVYVGNRLLMDNEGITFDDSSDTITKTALYVAIDGLPAGVIYIQDSIKKDAYETLKKIKNACVKQIIMLTGDVEDAALRIANSLNIDKNYSNLLPSDKVSITEKIIKNKTNNKKTAFVGDGINDAPVLSIADVGIAMGGLGSDAAIEAADIVIMNDELDKITTALAISRKTMSIVKQNIVFAIGIKVAVMVLSALGISDNMWLAIFADVGVAVLAILNALRTFNIKE